MKEKATPFDIGTRETLIAGNLHALAVRMLRRLRKGDDTSGLSPARLSALSVIVYSGPLRLGDLARAERVKPPTMTRLVQALESKGLVARARSSADKRAILLEPTEKGKALLEEARKRRIASLTSILADLEPQELEMLEQVVDILLPLITGSA